MEIIQKRLLRVMRQSFLTKYNMFSFDKSKKEYKCNKEKNVLK